MRRSEKPVTPSDFSMDSRRFFLEGSRADTIGAPRERVYVDIRTYEEDVRMVKDESNEVLSCPNSSNIRIRLNNAGRGGIHVNG